ncbi:MAG TPA: hypothetical protein DCS29_04865 [Candidatus Magasanikbacteria bacterium]|nr:hypothetical protein [Candidatus Magasanikbacteria bacterium]
MNRFEDGNAARQLAGLETHLKKIEGGKITVKGKDFIKGESVVEYITKKEETIKCVVVDKSQDKDTGLILEPLEGKMVGRQFAIPGNKVDGLEIVYIREPEPESEDQTDLVLHTPISTETTLPREKTAVSTKPGTTTHDHVTTPEGKASQTEFGEEEQKTHDQSIIDELGAIAEIHNQPSLTAGEQEDVRERLYTLLRKEPRLKEPPYSTAMLRLLKIYDKDMAPIEVAPGKKVESGRTATPEEKAQFYPFGPEIQQEEKPTHPSGTTTYGHVATPEEKAKFYPLGPEVEEDTTIELTDTERKIIDAVISSGGQYNLGENWQRTIEILKYLDIKLGKARVWNNTEETKGIGGKLKSLFKSRNAGEKQVERRQLEFHRILIDMGIYGGHTTQAMRDTIRERGQKGENPISQAGAGR